MLQPRRMQMLQPRSRMLQPQLRKMSREELQELILQNCQEWISLDDLAKLIHRSPIYLRNHVMPILLATNMIQMLYPKTIVHHQSHIAFRWR